MEEGRKDKKVRLWVLKTGGFGEINPSVEEISEAIKQGPWIDLCLNFPNTGHFRRSDHFVSYGFPLNIYISRTELIRSTNLLTIQEILERARNYGRGFGDSEGREVLLQKLYYFEPQIGVENREKISVDLHKMWEEKGKPKACGIVQLLRND